MNATLSKTGKLQLPASARRALGARPGDKLRVEVEGATVKLSRPRRRPVRLKIARHPLTGLPYAVAAKRARAVTEADVREALADFP